MGRVVPYIYETTCDVNNKKYIGQHIGELSDKYYGSGVAIKEAIKKYGIEHFHKKILWICNDPKELNEKERYFTDLVDAENNPNYYNLIPGGGQPPAKDEKIKKRISTTLKKYYKENPEKREAIRKQHLNSIPSEETRKRMSEAHKGKLHTQQTKEKMRWSMGQNIKAVDVKTQKEIFFPSKSSALEFLGFTSRDTKTLTKRVADHLPYHGYKWYKKEEN